MKTPIEQFEEKFGTSMTMLEIKILIKELKIKEQEMIENAFIDGASYEANLHDDCIFLTSTRVSKQYYINKFIK